MYPLSIVAVLVLICPFAKTNCLCPRSEQGENPCVFQKPPVVHDSILPPVAPEGNNPAAGVLPSGATGGKIESCTTGGYWNTQGFSPCSDIGQRKFVLANGQTNNSTQTILRGYKAADVNSDYGFRHNGGNSQVIGANGLFVGGGGAGAGGGNAASVADSGGGGASGYSNGTVTITSAQQGGNNSSFAFAQIRLLT